MQFEEEQTQNLKDWIIKRLENMYVAFLVEPEPHSAQDATLPEGTRLRLLFRDNAPGAITLNIRVANLSTAQMPMRMY